MQYHKMPPGSHRIGNRFRRRVDALARAVITFAGISVILAISGIFLFIFLEILPLMSGAKAQQTGKQSLGQDDPVLVVASDQYRERLFVVRSSGVLELYKIGQGLDDPLERHSLTGGARVTAAAYEPRQEILTVANGTGEVAFWRVRLQPQFEGTKRRITLDLGAIGSMSLGNGFRAERLVSAHPEAGTHVVAAWGNGELRVATRLQTETPAGDVNVESNVATLDIPAAETLRVLTLTSDGSRLVAGTSEGTLQRWQIAPGMPPEHVESVLGGSKTGTAITALGWLIGDRTLVVGDAQGVVSAWILVRSDQAPDGWRTTRIHEFEGHSNPVQQVAVSQRNKSFFTADESGVVKLHHSTSEQTLLNLMGTSESVQALGYAPKGDGVIVADETGTISVWQITAPHPEVSWRTLFGTIWYEGYQAPDYVWQSSGGTDDFEPKLSLVPLLFGTIKGTLYAMLFALPVAILGAIYTSQFLRPGLRTIVKSTVEVMAAVPSVVLGFLAALWLAPRLTEVVPGVLVALLIIPFVLMAASIAWLALPASMRVRLPEGSELFLLIPLLALAVWASFGVGGIVETYWLGGDFPRWLYDVVGERYDQRNSIVVGFAMGFAVIPIIFTIAEDALSNVPQRLISASLGLGATPWHTAIRVVLPTASPGIFSATLIGFGRAVGETMILLMATGNTPILDLSPFNGFRALSANIAVEIPEAPFGGTLYRVLFVAALLLFIMTFTLNTVAEFVRIRLRERYARL